MDRSCLQFAPALAVSFLTGLMSAAVVGQERGELPPTDAEINKQVRRLEQGNPEAERLEAVKWLERHAQAKNVHLAALALERCIRTDPSAKVRDAAVLSLGWIAKNRHQTCPLAIVEAMLDKDEFVSQTADAVAGWFKTFPRGSVEILLRCADSQDVNRRSRCLVHLAQ